MSVQTSDYFNTAQTLYLKLGRNLTEADIGKRVIRLSPFRGKDWSNCYSSKTTMHTSALVLDAVKQGNLQCSCIKDGLPTIRVLPKSWNDGKWTTVDELLKHLQATAQSTFCEY